MTEKVKKSGADGPGTERHWTRRVSCLTAVLRRPPKIPDGLLLRTSDPAALERLFHLVLQYNQAPDSFDLTGGFRADALRQVLREGEARAFHKLLGTFGQRYRFAPDRMLALATLVTSLLTAFEEVQEWLLASDGVTLHVVITGKLTPEDPASALNEVTRLAQAASALGLAIHECQDGHLQVGLALLLGGQHSGGLGFLIRVTSPALRASRPLPQAG